MDDLTNYTSDLKEVLNGITEYNDKEKLIFKHISDVEKLNVLIEDFPENLDWFNTSEPLTSDHLKGKIVVLDFFTYCCINCLHVIPHLRQLEENFSVADGLVVIGVHSAKFENEKDSQNILLALKRYNITHPVVNDKNCFMWTKLNISCWPTIVILGPSQQCLFVLVGEGHKNELLLFVKAALMFFKKSILPRQLPLLPCDEIITSSLFSFPGKISRWENLFAVSDSGNHRVIIFDKNGYIQFKIGGRNPGFKDGNFETARFNSPQGLVFNSNKIYIADTENHAIRLIDFEGLKVTTVVGTGVQGTDYQGGRIGTLQEISSPWDVCIVPCSDVEIPIATSFNVLPPPPPPPGCIPPPPLPSGDFPPLLPTSTSPKIDSDCSSKVLLIAAAGTHQIWAYFIDEGVWWKGRKYEKNVCVAVAGSGREENRNNRYPMMASFAQPSGLAYSSELKSVFIADSESSSIRKLSLKDGAVTHVAGGAKSPNNLFSFGDLDGKAYEAKLQHPIGVVWSSKADSLYVCDTYNHKIKAIDVRSSICKSLHQTRDLFNEPAGGCLDESEDFLYVCDTNNNCVKVICLSDGSVSKLEIQELETVVNTPSNDVWEVEIDLSPNGGTVTLKIEFAPKEIHGKWSLQLEETKVKCECYKGKLGTNFIEFNFELLPSKSDDVLLIFFDLVLCSTEICSFKKSNLKVTVRRRDASTNFAVCFAWNPVPQAPVRGPCISSRDPRLQSQVVESAEDSEFLPECSDYKGPILPEFLYDPEDRTRFPFFRYMRVRKTLGICSVDHPKRIFNCNELLEIADAIQDAIISPEGQKVRPRFFGTKFSNRKLVIIVGDNTTANWVKSLPGRLNTPNNLNFKVMEQGVKGRTVRVQGRFKRTGNDSCEKIMKYLEVQNVGIDFSNWKIVDRQIEKKGINILTFEIDWDSAQKLKHRGPNLNYKMGCADFVLGEIPNTQSVEVKCEDSEEAWVDTTAPSYPPSGTEQFSSFGAFYPGPGPSTGIQSLQNPFSNEQGNYKRPIKNKAGNFKKFKNKKSKRMKQKIKQEINMLPP